jgi:hypothetical protein
MPFRALVALGKDKGCVVQHFERVEDLPRQVLCLLSDVCCFLSCLLAPVRCLLSPVFCLLSPVFFTLSPFGHSDSTAPPQEKQGDVTVQVSYSTLNYKDGLVMEGKPGVVNV